MRRIQIIQGHNNILPHQEMLMRKRAPTENCDFNKVQIKVLGYLIILYIYVYITDLCLTYCIGRRRNHQRGLKMDHLVYQLVL